MLHSTAVELKMRDICLFRILKKETINVHFLTCKTAKRHKDVVKKNN